MFKKNQLITFTIFAGVESTTGDVLTEDSECSFTTRMDPLCASISDVRRRVGAHIQAIPDDTINQLILRHTEMAFCIAECDTDDPVWKKYANKWVVIMTALVLLDNSDAFSGSSAASISKVLGDFEISKKGPSTGSTKFTDLIDRLECELFKLEPAVRKCEPPRTSCLELTEPNATPRDYIPLLPAGVVKGACDPNNIAVGRRWVRHHLPLATDKVRLFNRLYKTRFHRGSSF